jgi:hypothetical protein
VTGGAGEDAFRLVLGVVVFATLVAPVLAPALAAVVLLDAMCCDGLTYRHAAALVGCLALFIYGCGSWSGHIWDLRGADEYCGGDLARAPTTHLLPLAHICFMADGTVHQLVSPIVNPALLACVVGGIAIAVGGRRRAARRRSARNVGLSRSA